MSGSSKDGVSAARSTLPEAAARNSDDLPINKPGQGASPDSDATSTPPLKQQRTPQSDVKPRKPKPDDGGSRKVFSAASEHWQAPPVSLAPPDGAATDKAAGFGPGAQVPLDQGSFEAQQKNRMDGDFAEALHLAGHVHLKSVTKDGGVELDTEVAREEDHAADTRVSTVDEDPDSTKLSARRPNAEPQVADPMDSRLMPPSKTTYVERHDKMMLAASTMKVPEIQTHLGYLNFFVLVTIMLSREWLRDPSLGTRSLPAGH